MLKQWRVVCTYKCAFVNSVVIVICVASVKFIVLVSKTCLHALTPLLTPQNGLTPLHIAAYFGNVDVINALVDRGANLEATERYVRLPACAGENGSPGTKP